MTNTELFKGYIGRKVEGFKWLEKNNGMTYRAQFISNRIRDEFKGALENPERCTFLIDGQQVDYTPEQHKALGGYKGLDSYIKMLWGE